MFNICEFFLDNNKLKLFNDNNHDTLLTPIYIFTIIFFKSLGFLYRCSSDSINYSQFMGYDSMNLKMMKEDNIS